jgi:hypothetical protein
VSSHDRADPGDLFGRHETMDEAIQHTAILQETWGVSMRARVETPAPGVGAQIPCFLLP